MTFWKIGKKIVSDFKHLFLKIKNKKIAKFCLTTRNKKMWKNLKTYQERKKRIKFKVLFKMFFSKKSREEEGGGGGWR